MSKTSRVSDDEAVLSNYTEAFGGWASALEQHRMAPPDSGFANRLASLADAAKDAASACRTTHASGYDWTPHPESESGPPYELRPGTGRRGPAETWQRFDAAVRQLSDVSAGEDMLAVADAYEALATIAAELARAISKEDHTSGSRPATRKRRSA